MAALLNREGYRRPPGVSGQAYAIFSSDNRFRVSGHGADIMIGLAHRKDAATNQLTRRLAAASINDASSSNDDDDDDDDDEEEEDYRAFWRRYTAPTATTSTRVRGSMATTHTGTSRSAAASRVPTLGAGDVVLRSVGNARYATLVGHNAAVKFTDETNSAPGASNPAPRLDATRRTAAAGPTQDGTGSALAFLLSSGGDSGGALGLDAGYALALGAGPAPFAESALLGALLSDLPAVRPGASPLRADHPPSLAAASPALPVWINTHEPFCFVAIGVQGAGKSHTLACMLENCLVPYPADDVVRLQQPMAGLVLHYDQNEHSIAEATGLIMPAALPQRAIGAAPSAAAPSASASTAQARPTRAPAPPHLPRNRMLVLVSPTFYVQRRAFYEGYAEVRPLLFRWSGLSADHIKRIMRVDDGQNQLYVVRASLCLLPPPRCIAPSHVQWQWFCRRPHAMISPARTYCSFRLHRRRCSTCCASFSGRASSPAFRRSFV